MDKTEANVTIVSIVAVLLLLLSFVGCNMHINYCTLKAIQAGTPALKASKAFSTGSGVGTADLMIEQQESKSK